MTILSWGYDGPVQEGPWSLLASMFGSPYSVADGTDQLRVTAVIGADRTVSVAPGSASCYGVVASSDSAVQRQFAVVSSGTRWDMIVLRYDWTTNTTTIEIVQGSASDTTAFNARENTRATKVDLPLALVQIAAGGALTAIIDLRVWMSGAGLVAAHDYARRYLEHLGTEVRVGALVWQYGLNNTGVPEWYRKSDLAIGVLATSSALEGSPKPADGQYLLQAGTITPTAGSTGYYEYTLPQAFPNGLLYASVESGDDNAAAGWQVTLAAYSRSKLAWGVRNASGARIPNVVHRVNWLAIGW